MKYQCIAIEGPIGVGKSALARQLAELFKATFLADADIDNPYLKSFYKDSGTAAFHTQVHFLVSRVDILKNPAVINPNQPIVADFMLDKNRLYAELTLDHTEWWMYTRLHDQQALNVANPDLVIYLQAPLERLIERIERFGADHEKRIDSHYLQQLSSLYERYFHGYDKTPLLIINTAEINLADESTEVQRLADKIRNFEGGRHYYNPMVMN